MSASLNKVMLVGNLGNDPEVKLIPKVDKKVVTFKLATGETWRDKNTNERRESTEWHNIVVYSPGLIELIEKYVKKGSRVYVEGKLVTTTWVDSSDVKRSSTKIVLQGYDSNLIMLDPKHKSTEFGKSNFSDDHNNAHNSHNLDFDRNVYGGEEIDLDDSDHPPF